MLTTPSNWISCVDGPQLNIQLDGSTKPHNSRDDQTGPLEFYTPINHPSGVGGGGGLLISTKGYMPKTDE